LSAKSQADTVLSLAAGEIRAGDYRLVFPEIVITPSSRIGLTGNNGAGKTLLVKKILTEIRKEDYFYLPQEPEAGELEEFLARFEARAAAQKAALLSSFYRLGGNPQNFGDYAAKAASPGELRKLLIAEALTRPLSLIVMDEPTNYMDITSVEILEEALAASACALLLVSHDTVFLSRLTTENWTVRRSCSEGRLLLS
jgi:ATPase subunit of ABC transporter with duplicated ATPase domains